MLVAYVSRSSGVHDSRFIGAWEATGFEVVPFVLGDDDDAESIADRIRRLDPDVVQAGPVTAPGASVARWWEGPLIQTSWGFDVMDGPSRSPEIELQARTALRRADLVFVDNQAVAARAVELGAAPDAIVDFPWGHAPEWLTPPDPVPHPGRVVLSTRRHEEMYRVGDLVEAFVALAPSFPEVRLTLAGSGSGTPSLRSRVEAAGLADRVAFLGDLDQAALRRAYLGSDLYVSTSRVDGTSISLMEAMASGVPAIVTRIPGNAQWVTAETGATFEVGDVAGLVQLLGRWLSQPAERDAAARRAAAARTLVLERADWERTSRRFPEYAAKAIERHRAR